jgi:hypothetical protein
MWATLTFVLVFCLMSAFILPVVRFDEWAGSVGNIVFFATFSVIPSYMLARWVYSRLRWSRTKDDGSVCIECGYDLTGNISGKCPECGYPTLEARLIGADEPTAGGGGPER